MNPHNWIVRVSPKGKLPPRWKCEYCDAVGTIDELRAVECSYVYPPCEYCGQTPECARDCPGIAAALSLPGVVVIGGDDER